MKIQLPTDTSAVSFIDVMPPDLVLDRQTKQQKTDATGEPLHSIELVRIGGRGRQGPVRSGLVFRVVEVEPLWAADAETVRQARPWCLTGSNR
jgi:hypothetical protein